MFDKLTFRFNITAWPELGINYWGINKNATSTFINHFYMLTNDRDLDVFENSGQEGKQRIKDRFIKPDRALDNGLLNFAITRNPFRRFESCYKQFKYPKHEAQRKSAVKAKFNPNWSADEFLEFIDYMFEHATENKINKHYKMQSDFLFLRDEMDHIIKLEEMQNVWPYDFSPPDFISNPSAQEDVKYSRTELVRVYFEDFENFGYDIE